MATDHLVVCGPGPPCACPGWGKATRHDLRLGGGKDDVHLRIDQVLSALCATPPPVAIDLLELAAYVYTADQAATRGGTQSIEYGRRWRRRFRFDVPVRCPELWGSAAVQAPLTAALSLLSDDHYELAFRPHPDPPPLGGYLFGPGTEGATLEACEEVVLFSGGLDSLAGAVQEVLVGQRRVALVSHRPVSKVTARQQALVRRLRERAPAPRLRPLHVGVEVNKGKQLGREFTQRARSFLFASLAAVVANLVGLHRLRVYENGVTSLNLPVCADAVGGRCSRTTHPQVLAEMGRLFTALFGHDFRIEAPFFWKTKAEVLDGLRATGHADLCALAVSCAHTIACTKDRPHCGLCSQCVDRRLSALAAGLSDAEDPPGGYRRDVLTGERVGAELNYAEGYVELARRIDRMKVPHELLQAFPEVARALRHVGLPADQAARRVFDLHQHHAAGVLRGLARAVGSDPDGLVRAGLAPNCLLAVALGRVAANGQAAAPAWDGPAPVALVVDEGTFEARLGAAVCYLGNGMEFRLLRRLNQSLGAFVTHECLREEVWGGEVERNTIHRTACNLRRRLREKGLEGVQIDGSAREHYRLLVGAATSA